ncbi:unnamed protein product [Parajaminaea phylloscopi]
MLRETRSENIDKTAQKILVAQRRAANRTANYERIRAQERKIEAKHMGAKLQRMKEKRKVTRPTDAQRAYDRAYRRRHPEKKDSQRAQARERYAALVRRSTPEGLRLRRKVLDKVARERDTYGTRALTLGSS